jgi:hypothetical protein
MTENDNNSWGLYDREGEPIDFERYSVLHDDPDYVVVAKDEVPGKRGYEVSTVWLGIDHGFSDDREPVIFETMVFGSVYDAWSNFCIRYESEEEAEAGHQEILAGVMNHDTPEAFLIVRGA